MKKFLVILLTLCSLVSFSACSHTASIATEPVAEPQVAESTVYWAQNEEKFLKDAQNPDSNLYNYIYYKEGALLEYYFRPGNVPEGWKFRGIKARPAYIAFMYSSDEWEDLGFYWFYSADGVAEQWLDNSVSKAYGKRVTPAQKDSNTQADPNTQYVSTLEKAKNEGPDKDEFGVRPTWTMDWAKDNHCFRANFPWKTADTEEKALPYLEMEQVYIK